MKILLIDNYDSFTYNLAHILEEQHGVELTVVRNKDIPAAVEHTFDGVMLSPGPGIPSEAGDLMEFLKTHIDKMPILGVCLGHQAIAESLGGSLKNTTKVYHGVDAEVNNRNNSMGLFTDLAGRFKVGRYHSWVVSPETLPAELEVTADLDDGTIMAIKHRSLPVYGLQFHPESILTPDGKHMITNWLKSLAS